VGDRVRHFFQTIRGDMGRIGGEDTRNTAHSIYRWSGRKLRTVRQNAE
jgi:hypothetical protein